MGDRTCSIPGCADSHHARGWCRMHHCRWLAHGDPLAKVWPIPPLERFWSRVKQQPNGCWVWTAGVNRRGYGLFEADWKAGGSMLAHRWSYEHFVGPIPDGLVIDHLCRNPPCVNPAHLEPVTQGENARRGRTGQHNSAKTHCPSGHPYSGDNLYLPPGGGRACRQCHRDAGRRVRASRRAAS